MKRKLLSLIILCLVVAFPAFSQTKVITGKVTAAEDGLPIPAASIKIPGTKIGTQTDVNGKYSIAIPPSAKSIEFSFLGFATVRENINARAVINISLKSDATGLNDVVVTGYYKRNKESFTGASTTITRKELEKFNTNNIFLLIQSVDPAFKVAQNNVKGSNPNVVPEISIRGIGSVGSNVNTPLVILDGFQVSMERLYDLDINRIESITLLKDASATILYGSRGGNGVVIIETRLPKAGKFTVTYEARPTLTLVDLSAYNLMNANEKLTYEKLAGAYTFTNETVSDPFWTSDYQMKLDNLYAKRLIDVKSGVNTYWLSQPVTSSISTAHSLRIEGGNEEVRYSIDASYQDVKGAMKESGRKKYGAGFNLVYRIPNKISLRNYASLTGNNAYNSPYGSFSQYVNMNPYERIYDDSGQLISIYNKVGENFGNTFGGNVYNPLYNASLPYKDDSHSAIISNNLSLEWFALKDLKVDILATIEKQFDDSEKYISPLDTRFISVKAKEDKGSYVLTNGGAFRYEARLSLQYSKRIKKHQLNAVLAGELRASTVQKTIYSLTGFVDDRFVSPSLALKYATDTRPDYTETPERLLGIPFNIHYDYDNRFLLDLSSRIDGSSKFGKENRYGSFWSAGVGYNLHKEAFFENNIASQLRIYANVGENGNDSFSANMTSTSYQYSSNGVYNKQIVAQYTNQGNPSLTWPKVFQTDLGLQSKIFNRIDLRFDWYNKVTNRMISQITTAPSLGFPNNSIFENLGKVRNRGFEISTSTLVTNNDRNNFSWYINLNVVSNRSKLLEISDELKKLNESNVVRDTIGGVANIVRPSVYFEQGQSMGVIRGGRSLGIDPANGREMFLTSGGQVTYNWNSNNQTIIGNTEPKIEGVLGTTLSYGRLSIQANFNYSLGGDVYNQTLVDRVENATPYLNVDKRVLDERWKQPGDLVNFKGISDNTVTQVSSRFVQRENYIRFSNLNINYDLGQGLLRKLKLQRVKFNLSTNDLFRISTVHMERGTDYPFSRTYNAGFLIQF
ncbi:SusC/RagA family TonB-linked outer membrane protein [Pedobacter riviphilus]|uniref:SusC/RagA family TonB-linked outer membrane protein n=1 Tax=Pedobacter riviphilus TaxID=2766984 RepID=A0ABX6TKE4_9SPHI|nr:SusC/RagA family TonB-linked outer membrane protein [Pedobacter riviphilus]QNR85152.1 SusC/RagA family TonB-linked outer membrane protein [Pedobacter riviphilus]